MSADDMDAFADCLISVVGYNLYLSGLSPVEELLLKAVGAKSVGSKYPDAPDGYAVGLDTRQLETLRTLIQSHCLERPIYVEANLEGPRGAIVPGPAAWATETVENSLGSGVEFNDEAYLESYVDWVTAVQVYAHKLTEMAALARKVNEEECERSQELRERYYQVHCSLEDRGQREDKALHDFFTSPKIGYANPENRLLAEILLVALESLERWDREHNK